MKLTNGYGIYTETEKWCNKKLVKVIYTVEAQFRGHVEIVFEGINRQECLAYCHRNGMKMIDRNRWHSLANPAFRKVHAKHPVDESKVFIGKVY